jgi:tRNA G37 N-methylase Trm5
MRHLSVPSHETQRWLTLCRGRGWLADSGVVALDDDQRALPLNPHAPDERDAVWEGHAHVVVEPTVKGPQRWQDRLPEELRQLPDDLWPSAYELQGDVLMVKVEPAVHPYESAMASAMLEQLPNVRLVCADEGVEGEFRVRQLRPLGSRDGSTSTRTQIKEHGTSIWVDPNEVYFSSRLSTQRHQTLETLKAFRQTMGRPLVVADPYAGVGPSLPLLLAADDLLGGFLVGDLNPKAVDLLAENLRGWIKIPSRFSPSAVVCTDALAWKDDAELCGQADVLLVNLPHNSLEHLPGLFPILRRDGFSLVRGWAIVDRTALGEQREALKATVEVAGGRCTTLVFEEIKGFSSTRCFVVFEVTVAWD